ncbi:hypothetical protein D9619_012186 [Psilocybe cf. subviscida]|uniref:Mak10-domain-containing protein n=1 Tax=Psilocybe cf. subviscida TaxID=2480587 RepID=A0A8H5B7J2_9AGAR|nr:hypothetical protein D9619_012186 [Psilocybe cf. subviscida]
MEAYVPPECEMPGLGYDFDDVTNVFREAGAEMEPNSLIFMEGFTLQESMSALEIGEPRLDTGLIIQEQVRPPFNPSQPLLPEEICWILDRALAFETEFYAGNFLAHTVHTLLYTHYLSLIDPDHFIMTSYAVDPERPPELITVVLRSCVQGLLKCCDLTWRQLSRGGVYDTEDWQSDKCEVSLLEGMQVETIVTNLEKAVNWVESSAKLSPERRPALRARLLLRRSLLQVLHAEIGKSMLRFQTAILEARDHLAQVQDTPAPECGPNSPAHLAFDPYIGRQLQMATPIRVISPPSFEQTCQTVAHYLDGLEELGLLASVPKISTWKIAGNLRQHMPGTFQQAPYVRALTQLTFYDGFLIFNKHIFDWIIDAFFFETVGVHYTTIKASILKRWIGEGEPPLKQLEGALKIILVKPFKTATDGIDVSDLSVNSVENHIDKVSLLWQLATLREIVLSGFQLELYAKEERAFAYWYTACIVELHLNCLHAFIPTLTQGSAELNETQTSVYNEMLYQVQYLTALQAMCLACSIVCMPLMSFDWQTLRPNFYRRYKWAFRDDFDNFETPLVLEPSLARFVRVCGEALKSNDPIPTEPIALARSLLADLVEKRNSGGWASMWSKDRIKLLEHLIRVCDSLAGLPQSAEEMDAFDAGLLQWDMSFHPWFPRLPTSNDQT